MKPDLKPETQTGNDACPDWLAAFSTHKICSFAKAAGTLNANVRRKLAREFIAQAQACGCFGQAATQSECRITFAKCLQFYFGFEYQLLRNQEFVTGFESQCGTSATPHIGRGIHLNQYGAKP